MRTLVIDIADLGAETHPDDRVVLYAPTNRRSSTPGRVTSTARVDVELEDGQATREVEPGPMVVQLQCRGIADTREKLVQVPEGTGEVVLADLLEDVYEYTPEVVAAAQQARNEAVGAARTAAQDAVDEAQEILTGYISRVTQAETNAEQAAERAEAGAERVGSAERVLDAETTVTGIANNLPATITTELNTQVPPAVAQALTAAGASTRSGTGSPEGRVTAPVGAVYTDTAATTGAIRWIKASGTGTTGWQVQYGDTGWRNITASQKIIGTIGEGGSVMIRRLGDMVTLRLVGPITGTGSSFEVRSIPSSFTPTMTLYLASPTWDGTFTTQITRYNMQMFGVGAGATVVRASGNIEFSWTVIRPWPTTLPGIPA